MGKRLEAQLEEAKAELVKRQHHLADMERKHSVAVIAAEAKKKAADEKAEKLSSAASALREKIETENKIVIYSRKPGREPDDDEMVDEKWHPDFLERVAAVVGVHYKDRSKIDPKNQQDSLYEQALRSLRFNMISKHPDVAKAERLSSAAHSEASSARSALWSVERPIEDAERAVKRQENEIREIEQKIKTRDFEKNQIAAVPTPEERKQIDEADEKAKAARAKLREMLEKKLTIPLKPS